MSCCHRCWLRQLIQAATTLGVEGMYLVDHMARTPKGGKPPKSTSVHKTSTDIQVWAPNQQSSLSVCMHVCTYVYIMCIHACFMYTCIFIYICIYIYMWVYIYIYVFMSIHMCICVAIPLSLLFFIVSRLLDFKSPAAWGIFMGSARQLRLRLRVR